MRRFFLYIFTIILLAIPIVSYASDVDAVEQVLANSAIVTSIVNEANKNADGKTVMSYNGQTGELKFNNSVYSELDSSVKKDFMENTLSYVKNSSLGSTQKNKVYNFIASQDESTSSAIRYLKNDTSADFAEARKWFAPFSGPISTVMGFLCICIFAFLSLSVVFDICYLVIPLFQLLLERGEEKKRPFGVSVEAWKVLKEVEGSTDKKDMLGTYVKKRAPVFFFLAIILSWLVSGKIYDIVAYFMDAFNF